MFDLKGARPRHPSSIMPPRRRQAPWQSALHEGGISLRGLESILRKAGVQGAGKRSIRAANREVLERVLHVETLALTDGGEFLWELAEPNLVIQTMVNESPALQEVYAAAARRFPCDQAHPWRLMLAMDEFTPGNKFLKKNRRKTMCFSANFKELGKQALFHELTWITCATIRSVIQAKVQGGWSHMLSRLIRLYLMGPLSMKVVGIPLILHGQVFVLWADLHSILTDLEGIKIALDWRGTSSVRCCLWCRNVWKLGSRCLPGHVDISCEDSTQFEPVDTNTLLGFVDVVLAAGEELAVGGRTKTSFQDLQQGLGINHNPLGLLADLELRSQFDVMSVIRTDWVHNMLQDGLLTHEVTGFLFHAKRKAGIGFDVWANIIRGDWKYPRHRAVKSSQLQYLFDAFHLSKSDSGGKEKFKFKCSASELLSLYTLLRHVAETQLYDHPRLGPEIASLKAACAVMDALVVAARSDYGSDYEPIGAAVDTALEQHLHLHKIAYGTKFVKPKTHIMRHVKRQIVTDEGADGMFVVERLNLRLKHVTEPVDNTTRMEFTILASLLTKHLLQLQETPSLQSGLRGPQQSLFDYAGVQIATGLEVDGRSFHVGDCVFDYESNVAGFVTACVAEGAAHYIIVRCLQGVGAPLEGSMRYVVTDNLRVLPARRVWETTAWYQDGAEWVVLR